MQAHIYNDKELFQLISEGDETAFRRLFHAYVPQLRPLVQHITRTSAITEDIIQDTFLKLWISRDKLTDIDNPRSWILRIVFHQSFSWLRRQAVHHKAMDIIQQPYLKKLILLLLHIQPAYLKILKYQNFLSQGSGQIYPEN